jgi:Ca2+:H+ antiporter
MKHREMTFNRVAVQTSTASLLLAAIGLLIPSVFHYAANTVPGRWTPALEQKLSLAIAVVLLGTYICTLAFSLLTHKQHFAGPPTEPRHEGAEPVWTRTKSFLVLLIATVVVAALSEFLVGSVEAAREKLGVSEVFIGIIVVAIVGNAAEHSTAVLMAMKNKMDLSLGIAVGSSLQIALFVAPVLVLVSGFLGHPMDLEFTIPETVAVIVAVHVVAQISNDGETNWLEGAQLLSLYLILGVLFYYLPGTH